MNRRIEIARGNQPADLLLKGGRVVNVLRSQGFPVPRTVASKMEELKRAAKGIGALPENPFSALSFLALPVIPELKLTDQGLVDGKTFRIIPIEAD